MNNSGEGNTAIPLSDILITANHSAKRSAKLRVNPREIFQNSYRAKKSVLMQQIISKQTY